MVSLVNTLASPYDMTEDRESRILVVSATLDQAKAVVKRTCSATLSFTNTSSVCLLSIAVIKLFVDDDSADLHPTNVDIPWTIKNKYYSADVHFHLVDYAYWDPQLALRVPAIIFVWTRGQVILSLTFRLTVPLICLSASPMPNKSSGCTRRSLASNLRSPSP